MAFTLRRIGAHLSVWRSFHTTPTPCLKKEWEKIIFKLELYRKYGLLKDDLLRDTDAEVKEAISRLPEEMQMKRLYRSIRAQQLYVEHNILPENEWTTFEDDHHYLQPYLEEVKRENIERREWNNNH